jgi:hypothetical protein
MRSEIPPRPPYVDPVVVPGLYRVICEEHDMSREVPNPGHAENLLIQHLRERHQPELTDVNLTQIALWVLALREDHLLKGGAYRGALGAWCELLGLPDAEAIAVAEAYAERPERPVIATVPPF